jgi:hypothetical protein
LVPGAPARHCIFDAVKRLKAQVRAQASCTPSKRLGTLQQTEGFPFMPEKLPAPEYESPDDRLTPPPEQGAVLNENRARQAVPLGRMRYVLIASLGLAAAGFIVLYLLLPR